jgi:DNA-binding transcriptional LysR family regulator
MAKAAARLSISQPAVSKAIADLEGTLGFQLLDRTVKGVEPTPYGHALLRWARAVFDDIQQGVAEIEFLADPTVGELRVGATEPIIAGLLPVILERLRRQHPRMTFRVRQMAATPEQSQALRDREIDLVLGRVLRSTDEDMNTEILFYERTFVVSGAGDRKRPRRKVAISDLLQKPWALPSPDTVVGSLVAEAFAASGLELPRANVVTVSTQLNCALTALGPYLTLVPGSMLHFSGKRLGLHALPVDLPIPPWPVAITTLKNRTVSPIAQLFIASARECAKPLSRLADTQ